MVDEAWEQQLLKQVEKDAQVASEQWIRHPDYYKRVNEWSARGWLGEPGVAGYLDGLRRGFANEGTSRRRAATPRRGERS